ncbi:FkbM family methyltransferase [Bacillus haimaensis]|uniref:FkbM family methyltransferase n=1 Tax=Bacillus haimaensis TaxID=3160967 RepID=UPI003AA895A8
MEYYSQIGQDKFVNENIFNGMENGFFVDIGAHDGISFSNSYFFEKHKNWSGICVEPLTDVFNLLKKNRACICIEGAIYIENSYADFRQLSGPLEMLSGLVTEYDKRHIKRINRQSENTGSESKIIKVKTFTLQSILDKFNVTHIDLLSIDTEGAELATLKSIDFTKVRVECIAVENNYQDKIVEEFLNNLGFSIIKKLEFEDIYLHNESKFLFEEKNSQYKN